jgi:geranylgeranyl pyrophosphate synthase
VETEIRRELDSSVTLIQEMGAYIAGAGGKRLRPILLLLAARLAGARGERPVRLACVVELLHTATLIHDDVVDQAPLRRGRPSANARWGDDASVLVGDHLYSKSFDLLVRDNDRAIMETLARATVSMTEAEVFQLERKRSGLASEADYVRIITQKTASFISACCRIGGLLGGVPSVQLEALTRYGLDIGVAFQISDDSLDFVADQDRLGKAVGADPPRGQAHAAAASPCWSARSRRRPTACATCCESTGSGPSRSTRSGASSSSTTAWSTPGRARTTTRRPRSSTSKRFHPRRSATSSRSSPTSWSTATAEPWRS